MAIGAFLWHYQRPAGPFPGSLILDRPFDLGVYVLKYVGSICAEHFISLDSELALVCGLLGIAALGWAAWMLVRRKIADLNAVLPYIGMSAYSIGSAALTGIGRAGLGTDQALSPRYCTMAVPLWSPPGPRP